MSEAETTTATPAKKVPKKRDHPLINKEGILRRLSKATTVDEFSAAIAVFKPSKHLLRETLKFGTTEGENVSLLEEYLTQHGMSTVGARGRAAPAAGEKRNYSVQSLKKGGDAFVRVPLEVLGVKKKDKVSISFRADRIIIKVKGAVATSDTPDTDTSAPAAAVPVEHIEMPTPEAAAA